MSSVFSLRVFRVSQTLPLEISDAKVEKIIENKEFSILMIVKLENFF